jgi:hypothetical protein
MRLADPPDWALMIAIHAAAIHGGYSIRRTGTTISWALVGAGPDVREQVLSRLPAAVRLLYRTVLLPRYARTTQLL